MPAKRRCSLAIEPCCRGWHTAVMALPRIYRGDT